MMQLKEKCPHGCKKVITINCSLCYNDWSVRIDLNQQRLIKIEQEKFQKEKEEIFKEIYKKLFTSSDDNKLEFRIGMDEWEELKQRLIK